jgi:hypothetical protein
MGVVFVMLSGEIEPQDKASAAPPGKIVTAQHYDYTGPEKCNIQGWNQRSNS